jgi:GNAT superfamily N-acetyltransferase
MPERDEVTIRRASEEDAVQIARVHLGTWRSAYHGLIPDSYLSALSIETRTQRWVEQLRAVAADRRPFVAVAETLIVGFVAMGASRDPDASGHEGEVYAIYVTPQNWGSGIGRRLLSAAEQDLHAMSYAEAILWCLEGNARARMFYEHAGWRADGGTTTREFDGTAIAEVRYRKMLASSPV